MPAENGSHCRGMALPSLPATGLCLVVTTGSTKVTPPRRRWSIPVNLSCLFRGTRTVHFIVLIILALSKQITNQTDDTDELGFSDRPPVSRLSWLSTLSAVTEGTLHVLGVREGAGSCRMRRHMRLTNCTDQRSAVSLRYSSALICARDAEGQHTAMVSNRSGPQSMEKMLNRAGSDMSLLSHPTELVRI